MDRVFSVDDIADQFWSPPPPPIRLTDGDSESASSTSSSSLKMMNRSSSEWAFQRFLQEASASNHSPSPTAPPPQPTTTYANVPAPPQDGVVEIKDNYSAKSLSNDNNQSNNNNNNNCSSEKKVGMASSFGGAPPPLSNIHVDSEEYQAFLRSRLNLACAAVALTRVFFVLFPHF